MNNEKNNQLKRKIPGIDKVLENTEIKKLASIYKNEFIKSVIKKTVYEIKKDIDSGLLSDISEEFIVKSFFVNWSRITENSLKPVINATGIVLHTNISRAPFGKKMFCEMAECISGYSNLEFNLSTGKRENRNYHITELLKTLTGAEDAIAVNNNAAAIMLVLHTISKSKEAVISRGELIEIGESFRIHEIMEASGAVLKEVGTTNKTKVEDYEKAFNLNTGIMVKAHKSNYTINGFTEEVSVSELANLCKCLKVPFYYDLGSGLLSKPDFLKEKTDEPFAEQIIKCGADIITFSGDKLLGGPQCGIIAGKKKYLSIIRKNPMLRALRVGKLTYSALAYTLRQHLLKPEKNELPIYQTLNQSENELISKAEKLKKLLLANNIESKIITSTAQCGGGTLPETFLKSYAVEIISEMKAKSIYDSLLNSDKPILSILKKGKILLDVFCLNDDEIEIIASSLNKMQNQ